MAFPTLVAWKPVVMYDFINSSKLNGWSKSYLPNPSSCVIYVRFHSELHWTCSSENMNTSTMAHTDEFVLLITGLSFIWWWNMWPGHEHSKIEQSSRVMMKLTLELGVCLQACPHFETERLPALVQGCLRSCFQLTFLQDLLLWIFRETRPNLADCELWWDVVKRLESGLFRKVPSLMLLQMQWITKAHG